MKLKKFSELGEREREQYNKGLERGGYEKIFNHCRYFYIRRRYSLIKEMMQCTQGKKVLEIGSTAWRGWLENNSILPSSLTCINISETELQAGKDSAVNSDNSPDFILMDAHDLQFEDETFDFVYGAAILHHQDMVPALDEIFRVLKPNGKILFVEPLDINPVGKIVRSLTKKARTAEDS